jgi:hypothetical protein
MFDGLLRSLLESNPKTIYDFYLEQHDFNTDPEKTTSIGTNTGYINFIEAIFEDCIQMFNKIPCKDKYPNLRFHNSDIRKLSNMAFTISRAMSDLVIKKEPISKILILYMKQFINYVSQYEVFKINEGDIDEQDEQFEQYKKYKKDLNIINKLIIKQRTRLGNTELHKELLKKLDSYTNTNFIEPFTAYQYNTDDQFIQKLVFTYLEIGDIYIVLRMLRNFDETKRSPHHTNSYSTGEQLNIISYTGSQHTENIKNILLYVLEIEEPIYYVKNSYSCIEFDDILKYLFTQSPESASANENSGPSGGGKKKFRKTKRNKKNIKDSRRKHKNKKTLRK